MVKESNSARGILCYKDYILVINHGHVFILLLMKWQYYISLF